MIVALNYDRVFTLCVMIDLINLFDNMIFSYLEKVLKDRVKYIFKGCVNYVFVKLYIDI